MVRLRRRIEMARAAALFGNGYLNFWAKNFLLH
jgi:hypothetical protein